MSQEAAVVVPVQEYNPDDKGNGSLEILVIAAVALVLIVGVAFGVRRMIRTRKTPSSTEEIRAMEGEQIA